MVLTSPRRRCRPIWSGRRLTLITPPLCLLMRPRVLIAQGSVDENSPPGTNVGKPVVANDAVGDILTYTLTGGDDDVLPHRPGHGQITVGPRTMLDAEPARWRTTVLSPSRSRPPTRRVTRLGANAQETVTITINDVNEAPMMTAGATKHPVSSDERHRLPSTSRRLVSTYMGDRG